MCPPGFVHQNGLSCLAIPNASFPSQRAAAAACATINARLASIETMEELRLAQVLLPEPSKNGSIFFPEQVAFKELLFFDIKNYAGLILNSIHLIMKW